MTQRRNKKSCWFCCVPVLQGLMEARSPYLEELLSLLMTAGMQTGTAGPVATVISLLLQESEERAVKKEVDSNKWAMQFYFPLKSCKKHSYLTGQMTNTAACDKNSKAATGVWLCTRKTAVGFGSGRFNWFLRLDNGLTDWLAVKIIEHFTESSVSGSSRSAGEAGTRWNDDIHTCSLL